MGTPAVLKLRSSIRRKLVSYFILVGLFPLLLAFWASYVTSNTALRSAVGATLREVALLTADKLEQRLEDMERRVVLFGSSPELVEVANSTSMLWSPVEFQLRLRAAGLSVLSARLEDDEGNSLVAFGIGGGQDEGGKTSLHAPLRWDSERGQAVAFFEMTVGGGGQGSAHLRLTLEPSEIYRTLSESAVADERRVWLVDEQGTILSGDGPNPAGAYCGGGILNLLRSHGLGSAAVGGAGTASGKDRLAGFAPVAAGGWDGPAALAVVVERDLDRALESMGLFFRLFLALSLLLTLLLYRSGMFWANRILVPIETLRAAVERVAGGDLKQRVQIHTGDELESLAAGFNEMGERLLAYRNAMERRLEEGVEQLEARTHALAISEEERKLSSTELGLLYAVSQSVLRSIDLGTTLQGIVDSARIVLSASYAYVLLWEDPQEILRGVAASPDWPGERPVIRRHENSRVMAALENRQMMVVSGATDHEGPASERWLTERAAVFVPMFHLGRPIGVITVADKDRTREWSEADLARARNIAGQAGIAIANARLHRDLQVQVENLTALNQLGQTVVGSLDLERLLEQTLEILAEHFHYDHSAILLPTADGQRLHCVAARGFPSEYGVGVKASIDQGIAGWVMKNGEDLLVGDVGSDDRFFGGIVDARSALAMALRKGNRVVGVLDVESTESDAFGKNDRRTLALFAPFLATAIENARSHGRMVASERMFRALFDVGQALVSTLDPTSLMNRALEILAERQGYPHCSILLVDSHGQHLYFEAQRGGSERHVTSGRQAIVTGICGEVARTQRPLRVDDVTTEPRYFDRWPATRSEIAVPILHRERLLGVLDVQSDRLRAFGDEDQDLLTLFAAQMASAIANARLFRERELALEASQEADRLKTQFLANTSHELRTPLTSIIGFSEVLLDGIPGELNQRQGQCVEDVLSSGKHLLGLINQLLDLSRIESGKMEPRPESLPMADVLADVESTISGLMERKSLRFVVGDITEAPVVYADRTMLKQVLLNLAGNAAKFTPEGGRIEITAIPAGEAERERLSDARVTSKGAVVLSVRDTGIGISEEDQELIFQEFRQVDGSHTREHQGSGLGLTISQRFVELNHGTIWVESEVGQGSAFHVCLPSTADVRLSDEPGESQAGVLHPDAPLLLVEDDLNSLKLLRRMLERAGYEVLTASSGEKGLSLARSARPRVIALDVMLPDMDGWTIMRHLKSSPETEHIPVIITSVLGNRDLGIGLGASDYFTKPVDKERFLARLEELGEWRPSEVLVVVDDTALRSSIVGALDRPAWRLRVVGATEDATVALESVDVVVVDLAFSGWQDVVEESQRQDRPVLLLADGELLSEEHRQFASEAELLVTKGDGAMDQLARALQRLDQARNRAIGSC